MMDGSGKVPVIFCTINVTGILFLTYLCEVTKDLRFEELIGRGVATNVGLNETIPGLFWFFSHTNLSYHARVL